LTAVFAYRTWPAFAGVLAALYRGHGYVPLNPTFPPERTRGMLDRSGAVAVVVDAACAEQIDFVTAGIERKLVIVAPECKDTAALAARVPGHTVLGAAELADGKRYDLAPSSPDSIAYLLFTSGSTGIPKGVMVANRNVTHFVDVMVERYSPTENDRFSQTFDFTFDLHAFDLWVAWERGAAVLCPTREETFMVYNFLNDRKPTVWFSVPSTGVQMKKMRMLEPGMYPGLRLSLFCGEALPATMVESWAAAAPNSIVENLYGPTEVTIACTAYRWDSSKSMAESENGVVPIGAPYPGMTALVADAELAEVPPGETGELLMCGPQVSLGYWKDAEKTAAAFVVPPGKSATHYRTGDRVRRPVGDAPLVYLGRMDNQIKVRGYRVELGEVEAALREAAGVDVAIAVGFPRSTSGADGIVAFVHGASGNAADIKAKLKLRLPAYMLPNDVRFMAEFPLNANGKVDRKALLAMLEAAKAKKSAARGVD
jgi:amino acid adenylation domain-containing protein